MSSKNGFILPLLIIILGLACCFMNMAFAQTRQNMRSARNYAAHLVLLADAKKITRQMLANLQGKIITVHLLSNVLQRQIIPDVLKRCEAQAYWLKAELVWHSISLGVSSRWADIKSDKKFCQNFKSGWQQTAWKEIENG